MAIDLIGTFKQLAKWTLQQVVILTSMLLLALAAPLIYTVGTEWVVWNNPTDTSWCVGYFMAGPFASAFWMVILCHFHSIRLWIREGKPLGMWSESHGGWLHNNLKATGFMVVGFLGSALAEGIFLVTAHDKFSLTRESMLLYFAIAPLAVFAPVILLLLKRWNYNERPEQVSERNRLNSEELYSDAELERDIARVAAQQHAARA